MGDDGLVRRHRSLSALTVLTAVAVAGVVYNVKAHQAAALCRVSAGASSYVLDLEQAANAATIAAVGKRDGLPDHAVTVALAAALQESKLHNVSYGDRDSVGLFQQRPSQGWGPRAKLLEPAYAAGAFYSHLARIPGWPQLAVADAAQQVQHSAAGSAYADWESEARSLASALTGEVAAGVTCHFAGTGTRTDAGPLSLAAAISGALGPGAVGTVVPTARGWTAAGWLVANAYRFDLTSVSYAQLMWTNQVGGWRSSGKQTDSVVYHRGPAG